MNRQILKLAIPNIISNITIPLLGLVGTMIAGQLGREEAIGALSVGAAIFNMIYWTCSFIRMGTGGLTAQAFGAGKERECMNILIRSAIVAIAVAFLLVLFRRPVWKLSLLMMSDNQTVMAMAAEYFFVRIWAAPASISLFAIHGWFIGMQDSKTPMFVSIISNVLNIALSALFALRLGMGISGIGWAAVISQYTGLILSWVFWIIKYRGYAKYASLRESLRWKPLLGFFNINKDIFIRSLCNTAVYTFFTIASTRFDAVTLATNTILMQLFYLFSYISDGFGYAAEALTGKFVGARDKVSLKDAIRKMFRWSAVIAVLYVTVYIFGWERILALFNATPAIIETARNYIWWIIAVPLLGFVPFLIDGILYGATQTKILRNTIIVATAVYFGLFYGFVGSLGNTAIWLAFVSYIFTRGVLQLIVTRNLNTDLLMEGRFYK